MELNKITKKNIGYSIEVHKQLGHALLESVYERALCIELKLMGLKFQRQKSLPILYKNESIRKLSIRLTNKL